LGTSATPFRTTGSTLADEAIQGLPQRCIVRCGDAPFRFRR
jgi:hypothetical protein